MPKFPSQQVFSNKRDSPPTKSSAKICQQQKNELDYSLKFIPSLFFYASSFQLLVLTIRAASGKCDLLASYRHSLVQPHIYFNILSLNSII